MTEEERRKAALRQKRRDELWQKAATPISLITLLLVLLKYLQQ